MNSFRDTRGKQWVACDECERGGNGGDDMKCSCGWNCKKYTGKGCFSGELMKKYKKDNER